MRNLLHRQKRAGFFLAVILAFASGQSAVLAHSDAQGVVKERMEMMERLEELLERLFAVAHGELPYSAELVTAAAEEIRDHSGESLVALFPKGSDGEPSEASPEIWRHSPMFSRYSTMLEATADYLVDLDAEPSGASQLPKKWEEVEVPRGMMPGGMMGGMRGLRRSAPDGMSEFDAALWQIAQTCNSCHQAFREED